MIKVDKKRKTRSGSKSQGTVPAFLLKTYEILENPNYNDIISWNKEGNAFIVKRINDFSEKILPKYFKHNNFASFVRQLNMYDFHKSRHENNENEFRHKLFKRGQKHLLGDIKRKISEGHGFGNNQLVPAGKDFDVDKFKKETNQFTNELGTIKRHQNDLEKVTKVIYNQNSQLLKENKLLWNELIKNKDKYERKIEKLMLFIFSVMHQSDKNQLGPSEGRKSLTNAELSETLNQITGDSEQAKRILGENENGTLSLPGDKKENEKFFQKITSYLQNKGNDNASIDSLLEQFQNGNPDDIFKNQPDTADEENAIEDRQNINPNIGLTRDLGQGAKTRTGRRGRQRRAEPTPLSMNSQNEEDFGEAPTKMLKTEPVPIYSLQQNLMNAHEPINMMNQEIPDESMRQVLSPFGLGLSRGASYRDNEMGALRAPQLIPQKSSMNDFIFPSPGSMAMPMKEDEMYNMNNFGRNEDDKRPGMLPPPMRNNSQMEDPISFSPTGFVNNPQNGYNFGQPFDETMYRN